PPGNHRNLHRSEIFRRDHSIVRFRKLIGAPSSPNNRKVHRRQKVVRRHHIRRTDSFHSRQARYSRLQCPVETQRLFSAFVVCPRKRQSHHEQILRIESRSYFLHASKAFQQQSRPDQQNERSSNLRRHQPLPQPLLPLSA